MQKKPLAKLYESYANRSRTILVQFNTTLPVESQEATACEPIHRNGSAFLIVRLQHLWGEFCRELVVRAAVGGCQTRSGLVLPAAPQIKRVRDILGVTKQFTKQPFFGPGSQWEDPNFAIRQAKFLKVANIDQISLGLGSVTTLLGYLKRVRNFIVHPNIDTRSKYAQTMRILGFRGLSPVQLMNQSMRGGIIIFENWVSDLETAAWNAVA